MKKTLALILILMISISCSSIEKATDKWKTPENAEAGLAPGEKSNYLLNKEGNNSEEKPKKQKKIKKKAIKR